MSENRKCDSLPPLLPARILSLDGQVLAKGLIDVESREGYFQASGPMLSENIETSTEVLAEANGQQYHLYGWHRCRNEVANHFHFHRDH